MASSMLILPIPTAGQIVTVPSPASLPAAQPEGAIRYSQSDDTLYTYDGTNWQPVAGGGGGGAVDSVNGQTGVVILDTDDIPEGAANFYYTTTRLQADLNTGTLDASFDQLSANVITNDVHVQDNFIILNSEVVGVPILSAGLEINRGSSTDAQILWNEATDRWQFGLASSLVNMIGLADLSATSPLVYNNTTGAFSLNAVPITLGGTGQTTALAAINALLPSQATHSGEILSTDGTNPSWIPLVVPPAITSLSGDVTATGPGAVVATVNSVGGSTASAINTATVAANNATPANVSSTIVSRDSSGNFAAGTITATLNGVANNVSGLVAIANGGTGQSNAQAAINNLSNNAATAIDGDVFQWLSGNAQFSALSIPALTGSPNTLAFYNSSGDLANTNYWLLQDNGIMNGTSTFAADNQSLLRLDADITLGDTRASLNLISGTLANNGTLSGFSSLLNLSFQDNASITDFINGINIGMQGIVTGNKQMANFYSNGSVGDSLTGIVINAADDVTNGGVMMNIYTQGDYGAQLTWYQAGNEAGNTNNGLVGIDLLNNGDSTNFVTMARLNSNGTIAKGLEIIQANINGNIGDGTGINVTGFNMYIQNTAFVDGNIGGFNIGNQANFSMVDGTFSGINASNTGAGYRFTGGSFFNNSDMVEEIRGFQFNSTGDARTMTGLDVYLKGNAGDDGTGIRVNVSDLTSSTQQINSINTYGGVVAFSSQYEPLSGGFVSSGNNNYTEVSIPAGSPLTGTDTFINNNVVAWLIQDDIAIGPIGLGQVHSSSISLLGVADTKTVDSISAFLIAGSVQNPGYADNGTISVFKGLDIAGVLAGGGGTLVTDFYAIHARAGFDSYAGATWGLRIEGSTAENYVNKLAIGTASLTAASGLSIDVNGELGISAVGSGLSVAEGTDARMGEATLIAGTVTVLNTSITAASRVFLSVQTGAGVIGTPYLTNVIAGTSFDIQSTSVADTSIVAYLIVEPI